jgi:enoyl-CoA hydratase/carnithine racemase
MECSNGYVRVDVDDRIATIIINGETDANAIDFSLAHDFREAVQWVERSKAQTVIVRGAGGIYCAGGDLTQSPEQFVETVDVSLDAIVQMYESGTPYIAAIERAAIGGGFEIAVACDLRVADADATLKLPEASFGIIPPAGAVRLLVHHVGVGRARELLLTGRSVSAATASDWGLVTRTVDETDSVYEKARSLAETIVDRPQSALTALNKSINEALPRPVNSAKWDLELAKPLIHSEEFTDRTRRFLDE